MTETTDKLFALTILKMFLFTPEIAINKTWSSVLVYMISRNLSTSNFFHPILPDTKLTDSTQFNVQSIVK